MPEIPRTKFNSPWTVAVIEAALNDVSSAKGSSESLTAALNAMRAEINSLSGGVHLKGAVDYYADLPVSPSEGDAYTVRYQGTSGTDPLGIEYAWATYQGTPQWIPIGVDPSVFAKQTEMDVVANAGAKNLITYTKIGTSVLSGTSYTHQGVTFTLLSDGTVSATRNSAGTDTSFCNLRLDTTAFYIDDYCDGNHVLSGCPLNGDTNGYDIRATNNSYNSIDNGQGVVLSDRGSQSSIWMQIRISKNYSPDNLIFKPMIRHAAITDPTFQPFARTNRELTVAEDEDRAALVELVDGGAKNLCNTDQSDIVKATYWHVPIRSIPSGDYVVSFGSLSSTDTDATTCNVRLGRASGSLYDSNQCERGSNVHVDVHIEDTADYLRIYYSDTNTHSTGDSITASNVMLCSKAAWDISHKYVPYCPSYQELYEMVLALQNGGTRSLSMRSEPEVTEQPEESEER